MMSFIEKINPAYCYGMSALLLAVFVINIIYYVKTKNKMLIIIGLLSFGLFYDMFITGLGETINASGCFYIVSIFRHIFHSLITPLLFIFALLVCRDCGKLMDKKYTYITLGITIFLSLSGIISIFTSPTYVKTFGGVMQLSIDKSNTYLFAKIILNFMSFGTLIPMIIASVVAVKYKKDFNLLIATIVMTATAGLGAVFFKTTMFVPTFIGEASIAIFFFKYIYDNHIKNTLTTVAPITKD